MSPITIAIAGGTGNLGAHVTRTALSAPYYTSQIGRVVVFTRDPAADKAKELEKLGAELVSISDGITADKFKGVDVYISCLAVPVTEEQDLLYVKAAIDAGVKVHFPAEYGIDTRRKHFKHAIWDNKVATVNKVRELAAGKMKIIGLSNGSFMELAIGPWLGMDTKEGVYSSIGPPITKWTITSEADIASSLIRLSVLAVENPSSVPDRVLISGDAVSIESVAAAMSKESGKTIDVKVVDSPEHYFAELDEKHGRESELLGYFRYLMSVGRIDLYKDNHNELVNPNESLWKWKKIQDYAKETKGRPWCGDEAYSV